MDYRTLGTTGTKVTPLCLGAMMFGAWGNTDHDDSIRIIHRALDAGINFIDTADVYSRGESEQIVGKALAGGRRDNVVLATKVHGTMGDGSGGDPNLQGNSRRWIIKEVEDSLRRLNTDWIDLYQIHRPEADTDIDETLGALTDLVHAGKVRYIGSSTFPASQIVEAQWVAQQRGRERFVCEQPPYSMLVREIEKDMLPTARRHRMGVIPWSPLAGGWLSGRYRKGQEIPTSTRAERIPGRYDLSTPENQVKLDKADALGQLADEAGITLIEMAIAFVIRHPAVTSAIIGPRTIEHLESQLAAADVVLSDDVLDRIDEIVPPGTTSARPTAAGRTRAWSPRRGVGSPTSASRSVRLPQPVGGVAVGREERLDRQFRDGHLDRRAERGDGRVERQRRRLGAGRQPQWDHQRQPAGILRGGLAGIAERLVEQLGSAWDRRSAAPRAAIDGRDAPSTRAG